MARLANSLVRLRDQVNAAYPNRSKASDGWIGDAAHASTPSDHNPNSQGVVNALDLTHSPATGFDAHALAERLRVNRHPNLRYIISNSRIASAGTGWNWKAYSGSNPHSKHIHISVGQPTTTTRDGQSTTNYDNTTNWNINAVTPQGDIMITENDRDPIRVISSEVKGWDFDAVHKGTWDAREVNAWKGRPWKDFIMQGWAEGAGWRAVRQQKMRDYDVLAKQVSELSTRPTKAELDAVVTNLKLSQEKVSELEKKAQELEAQVKENPDTQLINEGKSWLQKLIERFTK